MEKLWTKSGAILILSRKKQNQIRELFLSVWGLIRPIQFYRASLFYWAEINEWVELDPSQQLFDAQGFCQSKYNKISKE